MADPSVFAAAVGEDGPQGMAGSAVERQPPRSRKRRGRRADGSVVNQATASEHAASQPVNGLVDVSFLLAFLHYRSLIPFIVSGIVLGVLIRIVH